MRKISVPKSIKAEDLEYDVFQGRFGELVYLKKSLILLKMRNFLVLMILHKRKHSVAH